MISEAVSQQFLIHSGRWLQKQNETEMAFLLFSTASIAAPTVPDAKVKMVDMFRPKLGPPITKSNSSSLNKWFKAILTQVAGVPDSYQALVNKYTI